MNASSKHPITTDEHPLVLFDGVCNLCNGTVNYVIDHDPEGIFRFGSLQSAEARPYLERCGIEAPDEDQAHGSIVLVEGDRCYTRSTAALRIAQRLNGAARLLYGAIVLPRFLRDAVYDWIAARRYDWFGRRDACRLPTPELADRFLEDPAPVER